MREIFGIKTVEYKGKDKQFFIRIGVAHENEDGSLSCSFDYIPHDSKIKIVIKKENDNGAGTE